MAELEAILRKEFSGDFFVFAVHQNLAHTEARSDFLQTNLKKIGVKVNVGEIRFPHPQLSLSHTEGCTISLFTRSLYWGVGIDVESTERIISDKAVGGYLNTEELDRLGVISPSNRLRLWVIKEAVFKADNANKGRTLRNYSLPHLGDNGNALSKWDNATFKYSCCQWGKFIVAAAVKIGPQTQSA